LAEAFRIGLDFTARVLAVVKPIGRQRTSKRDLTIWKSYGPRCRCLLRPVRLTSVPFGAVDRFGVNAFKSDGRGEAWGGLNIDDAEVGSGYVGQGYSEGFGAGFAARPDVEQFTRVAGQLGFADARQEFRDVHVFADGFEVDADRYAAGDSYHGPAVRVGEVEFDSGDGFERGLAVFSGDEV
jgi:hypothetical protein